MFESSEKTRDFSQQFCYEETDSFKMNISSSTLIDEQIFDDSEYKPNQSDISADASQDIQEPIPIDYINENKFVICESQLDKLLEKMFCPQCADNTFSIKKLTSGTCIDVKIQCANDHNVLDWSSQPKIGKLPSFNLLLCASIVFAGTYFY